MKNIKICIGSACHLKGSEKVIEAFQNLIKEYNLENEIELYASFCLNNCTDGVSVMRWDKKVLSVCSNNVREVFDKEILPYI